MSMFATEEEVVHFRNGDLSQVSSKQESYETEEVFEIAHRGKGPANQLFSSEKVNSSPIVQCHHTSPYLTGFVSPSKT